MTSSVPHHVLFPHMIKLLKPVTGTLATRIHAQMFVCEGSSCTPWLGAERTEKGILVKWKALGPRPQETDSSQFTLVYQTPPFW